MRHTGRTLRWWCLLLVTCFALAGTGCAGPGDDGVGGTGATDYGDGIGGTGNTASTDGIGGTGSYHSGDGIGGTGIIGVVSALGSVFVNGLHVELPADVVVTRNGLPAATTTLARGQVVAIVTRQHGGRLQARELQILDALQGPVQRVDALDGVVQMMGQTLRMAPARVVTDGIAGNLAGISAGERLRVSGLWRADGSLDVTRIEAAEPSAPDLVFGPVSALAGGALRVGSVPVRGVDVRNVEIGQHVRVTGVADAGVLRADTVALRPLADFQQRVRRLVVEAYPGVDGATLVSLGAVRALLPADPRLRAPLRDAARTGERVVVEASVVSGRVQIDTVRPVQRVTPSSRPVPSPVTETPRIDTEATPRPETPVVDTRPQTFERPTTVERPVVIERPVRPDAIERPIRLDQPRDVRAVDALRP